MLLKTLNTDGTPHHERSDAWTHPGDVSTGGENVDECSVCGSLWPVCEGIRENGELGCTTPRCPACGSTLVGPLRLNNGRTVLRCRRCGEVTRV